MPNGINYCNATDWYTQDRQMNTKKGRKEMKKLSEAIAVRLTLIMVGAKKIGFQSVRFTIY